MRRSRGPGRRCGARCRVRQGFPLFVMVTPADMHDSVAAREALFLLRLVHPEITIVWADLAYAGTLVAWVRSFLHLTIKTVSRPKGAKGFVILPRPGRPSGPTHPCPVLPNPSTLLEASQVRRERHRDGRDDAVHRVVQDRLALGRVSA
ncbi:hypothetical protein E4K73_47125 [Streptomyces sp. IB201691-2A2]|nr:transposase [Streptomyces sp. IB201691-2A2]TRO56337.1 hypothetical protein E4K73_47125 [Streptomyces sp. IB201691-2A2]